MVEPDLLAQIAPLNGFWPIQHRVEMGRPSSEGALAFRSIRFQHWYNFYLSRSVWAGLSVSHSTSKGKVNVIAPSVTFSSPGFNMFIRPGLEIRRLSTAPTFESERVTATSHFRFKSRFMIDPKMYIAWTNRVYGGPFFRYEYDRPSIGYKHCMSLGKKWQAKFQIEADSKRRRFGYQVTCGVSYQHNDIFKSAVS
jgi:hypothetical protein